MIKKQQSGFSLVEALVSIFLISIVFLGIFGGFQLSVKISSQTKAKMQGVYLANQKIEELRNIPYSDISTSQEVVNVNDIDYTIQAIVESFDDCADGTIEGLDCDNQAVGADLAPDDYKKVKVIVSWEDFSPGEMVLSSYIASKSLETGEGKGAVRISLVDSSGQPIEILTGDQLSPCPSSTINIINDNYSFNQCYGTDFSSLGSRLLILDESVEADDYKIVITKDGYSREETFQSGDIYNGEIISVPERKNPTINEGELYPITFIIDQDSDLDITTMLTWGGDVFSDTFINSDDIEIMSNISIEEGSIILSEVNPTTYYSSGYLKSEEIIPGAITEWHELRFNDFEDADTDVIYQIYSGTSTIPEIDLPGNSFGFDSSPVDLSGLNIVEYPTLAIYASMNTSDTSKTPILYDWQISWKNGSATPLSYVNFNVRGDKIVGINASEQSIYKYSDNLTTSASGDLSFTDLNTDTYYFSDFSRYGGGLDLNTELSPMPFALLSGVSTSTILYLEADNSLLVRVYDMELSDPLFGATLRLTNSGLGYDQTLSTDISGEAIFIPLQISANYNLNIQMSDYYSQDVPVSITGDNLEVISLERYE